MARQPDAPVRKAKTVMAQALEWYACSATVHNDAYCASNRNLNLNSCSVACDSRLVNDMPHGIRAEHCPVG